MDPAVGGDAANLWGFLSAAIIAIGWVATEGIRRYKRSNGKSEPNGSEKISAKTLSELRLAQHENQCPHVLVFSQAIKDAQVETQGELLAIRESIDNIWKVLANKGGSE